MTAARLLLLACLRVTHTSFTCAQPSSQDTYKDRWLACARQVFAELDVDGSGELSAAEIAAAFSSHLAPCELRCLARGHGLQLCSDDRQSHGSSMRQATGCMAPC